MTHLKKTFKQDSRLLLSQSDPLWLSMWRFFSSFLVFIYLLPSNFILFLSCILLHNKLLFGTNLERGYILTHLCVSSPTISVCVSLSQCSFLICLLYLPCNSLQWVWPTRDSLSYWFNDASSCFTGICMSVCKHSVFMHKDSQANMYCQLRKHTLMLTTSVTLSLQLLDVSQMVKTIWRGVRQTHADGLILPGSICRLGETSKTGPDQWEMHF